MSMKDVPFIGHDESDIEWTNINKVILSKFLWENNFLKIEITNADIAETIFISSYYTNDCGTRTDQLDIAIPKVFLKDFIKVLTKFENND